MSNLTRNTTPTGANQSRSGFVDGSLPWADNNYPWSEAEYPWLNSEGKFNVSGTNLTRN